MATIRSTAGRAVVALGIAAGMAIGPHVAAPQVLADPGDCTSTGEPGDTSLNCSPAVIPNVGAPSEMEVDNMSPGVGSPSSPEHSGHH